MNKKILLFVCFLMAISTQAQLKKFSLEEAVLQQNRKFGADKLTGFQWIPNSSNYIYYTDSWTKMMSANVTKKDAVELVKLNDINTVLGTKIKSFFGVQWIDSTAILISETGKYYSYNIKNIIEIFTYIYT